MTTEDLRAVLMAIVRKDDDHTVRQFALLCVLSDGPPRTIRGLADEMGIGKPVVSRAVDRLALDLYAERIADPDDRRSVLVRLTRRGRGFVADAVKARAA